MFKNISKTVFIISLVSLLNDCSSEMLYPVIPLFLKEIGYSTILIGFIEGIAECFAGLTKIYMGSFSDKIQQRLPFVQFGYLLSVLSRPLIGITNIFFVIFMGRTIDRVGKGIRTGARDALLADEATADTKAEIFGFHRSLDTIGAIIGPLIALVFLYYYPKQYKTLFLITLIPGLLALYTTTFIKEKAKPVIKKDFSFTIEKFLNHFSFWKTAPKEFKIFMFFLFSFSILNSSDTFLLLRMKEMGYTENYILGAYILFNFSYALLSYPIGKIADKWNKNVILFIGFLLYAISYFILSFNIYFYTVITAFFIYGMFYAFSQGLIKSLLIEKVSGNQKATAIGFYEGINSFIMLFANIFTGLAFYHLGSQVTLHIIAIAVFILAILFLIKYYKK